MPTLSVTVDRVIYPASTEAQEAWYILATSQGKAKGRMAWRPREGEALILEGDWATYKGEREFAFKTARLDVPTSPRDQLHYVCVRTQGLGPIMEETIWSRAGERWQEIKDGEIPRLHGRLYENFRLACEVLKSTEAEAAVLAALMGKGATLNMAAKAWAMWGEETLGVVNADCYRLAELDGYSFRDVDAKIRREYGIGDGDPRRIKAAVVYVLRRLTDGGDTVALWADLFAQAIGMLGGYADEVGECTAALFEDGTLKAFPDSEGVSLAADWRAENEVWEFVTKQGGRQ